MNLRNKKGNINRIDAEETFIKKWHLSADTVGFTVDVRETFPGILY